MQCKQKAHLEKTYITLQIHKKKKNSQSDENNKIHEKHKT